MILCVLNSQNFETVVGAPEKPSGNTIVVVAQKPDCSSFLVLTGVVYPGLTEVTSIPQGYDFTYCQDWGLVMTPDHIARAKEDIIAKKEVVIDEYCETIARNKGYGRKDVQPSVACSGYSGFTNPYQSEALAYVAWVAALWPVVYQIMADVMDGIRAIPTDAELIAELPVMTWPTV